MSTLLVRLTPYALALAWVLIYVIGGWWAVLFAAIVGVSFEYLLFAAARMQAEADECADVTTAEERWEQWHGERAA